MCEIKFILYFVEGIKLSQDKFISLTKHGIDVISFLIHDIPPYPVKLEIILSTSQSK